jgi:hypothetical protein
MTVRREGAVIRLEGDCRVEEAETLTAFLENGGGWTVDVSQCRHLHAALVQALLRFGPMVQGVPENPFIRDMIVPILKAARG